MGHFFLNYNRSHKTDNTKILNCEYPSVPELVSNDILKLEPSHYQGLEYVLDKSQQKKRFVAIPTTSYSFMRYLRENTNLTFDTLNQMGDLSLIVKEKVKGGVEVISPHTNLVGRLNIF